MLPINLLFVSIVLLYMRSNDAWKSSRLINDISQQFRMRNSLYSSAPQHNGELPDDTLSRTKTNFRSTYSKLLLFSTAWLTASQSISIPNANAKAATESDFIDNLAALMLAKKVMEPTKKFVEVQAYDNARSNIKYILNDLQLQKQVTLLVQNSIEFCEDMDLIDAAQEAGNKVANTAIQYDSTVYTCVFIPSDDGTVPPNAEKYRTQAYNFFAAFNDDIDTLLKLGNEAQLQAAKLRADAKLKTLPQVLFKDTSAVRSSGI